MKYRIKRADWLLAVGIVAVILLAWLGLWLLAPAGGQVQVSVDGQLVMTLPLDRDTTVDIPLTEGQNTLVVAQGTVRMLTADCPDGLCLHHRAISQGGESIICLPHRVTVTVTGDAAVDGEV